jgi:hypothetical protein
VSFYLILDDYFFLTTTLIIGFYIINICYFWLFFLRLVDKISEYILRYPEDLEFHFHKSDVEGDGMVKLSDWTTIMSDTLQLKLQWTKLRSHLAPDGDSSHVDYRKFLGRYFIDCHGDHS